MWQQRTDVKGNGTASILEYIVWDFLVNKKGLKPDVDFVYQLPMLGGRSGAGGFVADFYLQSRQEVWNPAGLHFHYTATKDRMQDKLAKWLLAAKGIKVIFLWEDDLMNRRDYTLEQAWLGRQIPGRDV